MSAVRGLHLVLLVSLVAPVGAQDDGEFGGSGAGAVRVENEAKLAVPRAEADAVWQWLRQRYGAPSFLDRDGRRFSSTLGDERFIDRYFDSPDLDFLRAQSGLRHRSRIVMEGSALRKDGRQLVQIKLNRQDATGLERSEIKFPVEVPPGVDPANVRFVLGLVDKSDRIALAERLVEFGVVPQTLRPILTVDQNRKRVYLADQDGAFATITLDAVTCEGWWQSHTFTELELELNEIRYTQSDAGMRAWMNEVNRTIQADIQAAFPAIVQDQTPKYDKSFARLEAGAPLGLPLRTFIALGWSSGDVAGTALLLAGCLAGAVACVVVIRRRRGARGSEA